RSLQPQASPRPRRDRAFRGGGSPCVPKWRTRAFRGGEPVDAEAPGRACSLTPSGTPRIVRPNDERAARPRRRPGPNSQVEGSCRLVVVRSEWSEPRRTPTAGFFFLLGSMRGIRGRFG